MGEPKSSDLTSEGGAGRAAGETHLRGGPLSRDEPRDAVDSVAKRQSEDSDRVLRTDAEEDTLYEDGLELENDSRPLTGINGKDDT
jgi:hypothetical protein